MKCLIFDLFHVYEKVKKDADPASSAINLIKEIEKEEGSTHTIVVKSDISRNWRSNLGFGYKNPTSNIKIDDTVILSRMIKAIEGEGIRVEGFVGMEAVDLFSTLSSKMSPNKDVKIIGYTDDIKALFSINRRVIVKDLITGKVKSHEWVSQKFHTPKMMKVYYANTGVNSLKIKPGDNSASKKEVLENIEIKTKEFFENESNLSPELKRNYKILGTMQNLELGFKLSDIARQ